MISDKKMANAMGHQDVSKPKPDMASVFFSTLMISALVCLFLTSIVNHLKPTNLSIERVSPDL